MWTEQIRHKAIEDALFQSLSRDSTHVDLQRIVQRLRARSSFNPSSRDSTHVDAGHHR